MKKSKLWGTVACVLALTMAGSMIGCGNEGKPSSTTSASAGTSVKDETTASSEGKAATHETGVKDVSEITVAAIFGVGDEYWQLVEKGVRDACADAGLPDANLLISTGAENSSDVANYINTYVAQDVDAIICTSSPDYNDVLKDASDNGIYVGLIDNAEEQSFSAACYGYTHRMLGEAVAPIAAEVAKEYCDGKVKIHAIHLVQGSVVDERTNGFVDTLKELLGEENVELISESSALDEQTAMQQTRDALTANPDINIVFSESIVDGAGSYSAIDQLGMSGKVFNFTLEATIQACEQLADPNDPIYQGFAMMKPYDNGYDLAERVIKIATGEVTEYTPGEYTPMEVNVLTKETPEAIQAQIETYESLLNS